MKANVEIDTNSGFCYGVIRAVTTAEKNLKSQKLYSLGAIVHNGSELKRLCDKGLQVIDHDRLKELKNVTVLIRAHGEPPATYSVAAQNNIRLIDCTCPVVLKLQKKIAQTEGQILIFGKKGHAEVNGLVGMAEGRAVVIENQADIDTLSPSVFTKPVNIFSQTTKDPIEFETICVYLRTKMESRELLTVHNTICRQVAERHSKLSQFAENHNVIIFISGKESSNGHVLYELCRNVNSRSYHIAALKEIKREWFRKGDSIGICGATSTPKWQLASCAKFLKIFLNNYLCRIIYNLIYGNYRRF